VEYAITIPIRKSTEMNRRIVFRSKQEFYAIVRLVG